MTAEQFIKDYTNHCSNELTDGGFHEWLTPEQALRAVEIAKDSIIEKTCQFIKEHHHEFSFWNTEEYELEFSTQKFIEDFKNYIKENKS